MSTAGGEHLNGLELCGRNFLKHWFTEARQGVRGRENVIDIVLEMADWGD